MKKPQAKQPPKKRGRPPLPSGAALPRRDVRLSDEHWQKAKQIAPDGRPTTGIRLALDAVKPPKKEGKP